EVSQLGIDRHNFNLNGPAHPETTAARHSRAQGAESPHSDFALESILRRTGSREVRNCSCEESPGIASACSIHNADRSAAANICSLHGRRKSGIALFVSEVFGESLARGI